MSLQHIEGAGGTGQCYVIMEGIGHFVAMCYNGGRGCQKVSDFVLRNI